MNESPKRTKNSSSIAEVLYQRGPAQPSAQPKGTQAVSALVPRKNMSTMTSAIQQLAPTTHVVDIKARHFDEKIVSKPTALTLQRKRRSFPEGAKSTVFSADPPITDRKPTRGLAMHVDPFDASRQIATARPLLKRSATTERPLTTERKHGQRHVEQHFTPKVGFVCASGCLLTGGKRVTAVHKTETTSLGVAAQPWHASKKMAPRTQHFDELNRHIGKSQFKGNINRVATMSLPTREKCVDPKYNYSTPWHRSTPRGEVPREMPSLIGPWDRNVTVRSDRKGGLTDRGLAAPPPFHVETK